MSDCNHCYCTPVIGRKHPGHFECCKCGDIMHRQFVKEAKRATEMCERYEVIDGREVFRCVLPLGHERHRDATGMEWNEPCAECVRLREALNHAIYALAPRRKTAGGCGTPLCNGWLAEAKVVDGCVVVEYDCPCHSESGWDDLTDFLNDCEDGAPA